MNKINREQEKLKELLKTSDQLNRKIQKQQRLIDKKQKAKTRGKKRMA